MNCLTTEMYIKWEKWCDTHDRDNYGRFDAFKAGYQIALETLTEEMKKEELESRILESKKFS